MCLDTSAGPGGTPPFIAPGTGSGSTPPSQPGLGGPAAAKPGIGSNIMKYLMPMLNPGVMGAMSPITQLISMFKK